ncbi:MAG: hypothetical protein RLZZ490_363 [Cyanobacteriota bacterium]
MIFEQSIEINASAITVERCFTDLDLMHQWLNPLLRCEPVGDWSTAIGARSRFVIDIPMVQPTLKSVVVGRSPGLVIWEFSGFFEGRDRWECQPIPQGTYLLNRFEFTIPNPMVGWGFQVFAAKLTSNDMRSQLRRLKQVAERIYLNSGD